MDTTKRLATLNRVRRFSRLMDSAIRVPGTGFRFGLDPILGLIPGGGDLIAAALSAYIVFVAFRFRLPPQILGKMVFYIALEAVVGTIPLVGDLFDAYFKANIRNFELLEQHLTEVDSEIPEVVTTLPNYKK